MVGWVVVKWYTPQLFILETVLVGKFVGDIRTPFLSFLQLIPSVPDHSHHLSALANGANKTISAITIKLFISSPYSVHVPTDEDTYQSSAFIDIKHILSVAAPAE